MKGSSTDGTTIGDISNFNSLQSGQAYRVRFMMLCLDIIEFGHHGEVMGGICRRFARSVVTPHNCCARRCYRSVYEEWRGKRLFIEMPGLATWA